MRDDAVLILGGYGLVGRTIAALLLRETPVNVIIAGRDTTRADTVAAELRSASANGRVSTRYADAADLGSLREALRGVRMVVNTTTAPSLAGQVSRAALDSDCDYLDTLISESTIEDLGALTEEIVGKRRVFITQAGFHPGLPAVLIRRAAAGFDDCRSAIVGMAMNAHFERPGQAAEIIPLVADFKADICTSGRWRQATFRDAITMDMGPRFGRVRLVPMPMPEIRATQRQYGLRDTGVYVSGFNWFVDNIVMPLIFVTQKVRKGSLTRPLAALFVWGVNRFSPPYEGVVMVCEASGTKNGSNSAVRITAEHDDAYMFTAIPVVACVKQYLDGALPVGPAMMGLAVDDERLCRDMEAMGMRLNLEPRVPGSAHPDHEHRSVPKPAR